MTQHRNLAAGRWGTMSFMEQMANIGSEVSRTSRWMHKENDGQAVKAFERALELIDWINDKYLLPFAVGYSLQRKRAQK